ncbi:MAG: hypothetical protein ABID54_11835, partial [Pseudomonadota bacterium]
MKQEGRGDGSEGCLSPGTGPREAVKKRDLSEPRKRLVELMQEVNYGRIEELQVQDGEPVFDPPPTVLRLFLFGKDNGPNESRGNDGFALKKKVSELFEVFD